MVLIKKLNKIHFDIFYDFKAICQVKSMQYSEFLSIIFTSESYVDLK